MKIKTFEEYKEFLAEKQKYNSWYELMLSAGHHRSKIEATALNLYNIYLRKCQEDTNSKLNKAREIIYE